MDCLAVGVQLGAKLTRGSLPGMQAASALGLPGPRQSVGLEVQGNAFAVLLPYSVCAPCSATQVFTTVHDGQTQVRHSAALIAGITPPTLPLPS